ncbi:hypothetical protein M3D75_08195 [Microbacterium enclense]|uniref:hypothetical protein n=1 Tax=Microbacterium enclense TaxID=993073 RepID=UPI0021A279D7|nr:hypothetical protein [Microbacterium enclense]MCT2086090.1 hypothetical protein [Microbacterium enclense]
MTSAPGIPRPSRTRVSGAIGSALGRAFAVAQRVRHPRPIHSRGVVLGGELRRIPDATPAGIAWIDDASADARPVVARVSRSIGLPAPLPDVLGLALRVDDADIEFASTGWGVPGRFALVPRRRAERASFGILLPYRGERGPVLLGARTVSGRPPATDPRALTGPDVDAVWTLELSHATARGPWHPFALVELRIDPDPDDRGLRFDAVRRPLPGARTYAWVRAARQPSYARVQHDAPPPRPAPDAGATDAETARA